MRIGIVTHFDAAHFLEWERRGKEVHGHTYRVEVVIEGDLDDRGVVMDFLDLKKEVEKVTDNLDHKNLNVILDPPTCENISKFIYRELRKALPVVSVKVWEGQGKWAESIGR
ncbi:MAG: 6-pyruvoyl tetrahydropterin synthase family protein [Candidatus Bathyarchaeia archaeon]